MTPRTTRRRRTEDDVHTDEMFAPFCHNALCHALPCLCHAFTAEQPPAATWHVLLQLAYLVAVAAPIACRAYDAKVVVWQLLLVVRDVASAFFIFSTLLVHPESSSAASAAASAMRFKMRVAAFVLLALCVTSRFQNAVAVAKSRSASALSSQPSCSVATTVIRMAVTASDFEQAASLAVSWSALLAVGWWRRPAVCSVPRYPKERATSWFMHSVISEAVAGDRNGDRSPRLNALLTRVPRHLDAKRPERYLRKPPRGGVIQCHRSALWRPTIGVQFTSTK
jgi:hypothetical protein